MAAAAAEGENIILFPFMAQGHIVPFLALALHIEQTRKNHTVTIINTPLNIKNLRASIPPESSINLLEIPFTSSDHGLPPNTENTDVLPYHLVVRLLDASTSLRPSFKELLQKLMDPQLGHHRPLCIIADIFFGWTASVAKELGLFHLIFSGASGYGLASYYSLWMNLPHRKKDFHEFSLPDFPEIHTLHKTQLPINISEANGADDWSLFMRNNLSEWANSDGILFNTLQEFDSLGLLYFQRKLGRPVWAVGPVLLSTEIRSCGKRGGISPEVCREWLDTKPLNSVLFVCFGSMNTISASQMMELALALEESRRNFIWVVRPPIGFNINSEFNAEEWLPRGILGRIQESKRGMIVHNWAPQMEILSHVAISAFLSHCGWNSVLEALSHGVPILGWPMAAEQFFNCKFLEEQVGVCLEVARGKSCDVRHEDIAAKIELVMSGREIGKEMRRKACNIRDMIRNAVKKEDTYKGSSLKAMDDFLSAAAAFMKEKTKDTRSTLKK